MNKRFSADMVTDGPVGGAFVPPEKVAGSLPYNIVKAAGSVSKEKDVRGRTFDFRDILRATGISSF